MKYRPLGRTGWKVSVLGTGGLRLPIIDNDHSHVDEEEATRLIRHAVDNGVNLIDTAYDAHFGSGEPCVGKALRDGYRDRVHLCTKLPSELVEEKGDFDRFFDEQLAHLQTNRIDLYLLHSLNRAFWETLSRFNVLSWAERKMAEGLIGQLGFSFHDEYPVFQQIVDSYDNWAACMIQYNFMDVELQAGLKGLRYAHARGLGVIVMEPLRGGQLTRNPPKEIQALWNSSSKKRTPADWCLQWVWNHPEVSSALSGMGTMEQLQQNLVSAEHSAPDSLSKEELDIVESVRKRYQEFIAVPCTACRYCLPCPFGVDIPEIFQFYNEAMMFDDAEKARSYYYWLIDDEAKADRCTECGECEMKCPQKIAIRKHLKKAHNLLKV